MRNILLMMLVVFSSCRKSEISKVYENREYLSNLCSNIELLKSRGNNVLFFETYNDSTKNQYFFDLKGDTAIMVRKEIRYEPDVVIKNTQDKREVEKYVETLNEKLKAYQITGCSTGFGSLGEKMKFYMSDGIVVVHVPDRKVISDEKYQSSLKEIGNSWYYY
ncbi:hypothetical protein ACR79T_16670 [Sphingobacterium spiritivorum]|uniref:hypothetical protein n=1 Tax=Sphingobacterium spiritivorum TaxID=258 RepID=UPI003DA5A200